MMCSKTEYLNSRYKILEIIGKGGQGSVYKVSDSHVFDKIKAAKEVITESESDVDALILFKKEAVFLSSLDHPGLPKITDFFKEHGKYYIIMDYIEGKNLEEIISKYPDFFTEPRTLEIALMLCDILNYTHTLKPKPLIFRDLKPANIIFHKNNIVLVDFGTARFSDANKMKDTFHFGTIGYAPPEQYGGLTDIRSDIYAFGATLYHLLTNHDPRYEDGFPKGGVSVKKYNKTLSADIDRIIRKMTNFDKQKRYQSILEVKSDLLRCSSIRKCPRCGKINSSSKVTCVACKSKLDLKSSNIRKEIFLLVGIKGSNKVYEFNKDMLTIGRNSNNDIILDIPSISRNHAVLTKDTSGFLLSDLGSKSGTYIKSNKITKKISKNLIKPGWHIKFGKDTEFVFKKKNKAVS